MKTRFGYKVFFVSLIIFFKLSCEEVGEMQHHSRQIELGNLKSAEIELDINSGSLKVTGGAKGLMDAHFSYNVKRWKPEINFHSLDSHGIISVDQTGSSGLHTGNAKNRWDINLNSSIPLNLVIDFGAGEGRLNLKDVILRTLDIDMGVGDLIVDLAGKRDHNLDVSIEGGIGHATIYLPENMGTRIKVDGGIGSVHAIGMNKNGNIYSNDLYGKTEILLTIDIDAGIGSIDLISG